MEGLDSASFTECSERSGGWRVRYRDRMLIIVAVLANMLDLGRALSRRASVNVRARGSTE